MNRQEFFRKPEGRWSAETQIFKICKIRSNC